MFSYNGADSMNMRDTISEKQEKNMVHFAERNKSDDRGYIDMQEKPSR